MPWATYREARLSGRSETAEPIGFLLKPEQGIHLVWSADHPVRLNIGTWNIGQGMLRRAADLKFREMTKEQWDALISTKSESLFDYIRAEESGPIVETKTPWTVIKPAGQIVLFKKVMDDWGFNDQEAAALLGFETASDIDEIYLGMKPVRQRDANDRLRAILRIATDLDALFGEVAAIRDWLSEPQHDLDGATSRALLTN